MTRISRFLTSSLAAAMLITASWLAAPAASAQSLPIDAFYGHFQGSGVAENSDSLYFGVTVRDLDVRIGAEGTGFYVEWTSVIRGGGDPNNPDIRRRTQRDVFINILEIDKPEVDAQLVAEAIGMQLVRRVAFRRAMRKAVESAQRFGAKGVKVRVAGRLGGAEIARSEWYLEGQLPLHTMRADEKAASAMYSQARFTFPSLSSG